MAVYKSTHCYPFMNSIDIRVARADTDNAIPVQYLKCKVNTSNKNITGYKIRVLDSNNNQIFPAEGENLISPLIELQTGNMSSLYENNGLNSGVNGTFLQIPFFQNLDDKKTVSYNAVYYKPKYTVDYVIMDDALSEELGVNGGVDLAMDANNWSLTETGNLKYNWPSYSENVEVVDQATSEDVTIQGEMYLPDSPADAMNVYYYDGTYNPEYDYDELRNRIRIDDETLLEGQIILVARKDVSNLQQDSAPNGFYRVVKTTKLIYGRYTIQTELSPLNNYGWILSDGVCAVVQRGEMAHNVIFQYHSDTQNFSKYESTDAGGGLYYKYDQDRNLEALEGFNVHGSLLKWEITLYQGEDGDVSGGDPKRITYSNLDNRYLDMTVGAGTILGSNSSRIQIARQQAFLSGGSTPIPNSNAIIPKAKNGTLILQGRYADLSYYSNNIFSGNRIYVQTYDATYGHVYPQDGALDSLGVNNATHVQFFKYTNNPDSIKSQDIVDFGVGYNITFSYYQYIPATTTESASYIEVDEETFNSLSISTRVYGIKKTSLPLAFQGLIQPGNKIIFTGQGDDAQGNHAYQNGVYEISLITTPEANLSFILKRASSYSNWGSYIGKIIYCSNYNLTRDGGTVSRNLESLADTGSSNLLWNPNDINGSILTTTTGTNLRASYLYFTEEMPILLFEELVSDDRYYEAFYEGTRSSYIVNSLIDGIIPTENSVVLVSGNEGDTPTPYYYREGDLREITDPAERERLTPTGRNEYCYFGRGAKWGKRIWVTGSSFVADWSLYTAVILKNSPNYTYISPFMDVENTMKLKLTGGKTVKLNTSIGVVESSWLTIMGVNTNLFCVYHERLSDPLTLESEFSSKADTPWHYEIKSYFKKSDENPFYCYENPYLLLYKNNNDYSTLVNLKIDKEFWTKRSGGSEPYWVSNNTASQFIVREVQDASVIYGKSVKLSAQYIQFDGLSWESYRWTLADSNGKILQDTGRKYDKNMSVIFYGLSNDNENTYSTFYATLYVEDEYENVLTYIIKLTVKAGDTIDNYFPFTAEYDCDSHAVKLEYVSNGIFTSTYRDSLGYDNSVLTYKNNGVVYDNGDGVSVYNLTRYGSIDTSGEPIIYYNNGSTIDSSDAELYSSRLSIENNIGLPYYTFIEDPNKGHYADSHDNFLLQKNSNDIENNGQLYFETEFNLDDSFCGNILNFEVEGVSDEALEAPYIREDGQTNNLRGYIVFNFKTYDNLDNENLVSKRNLINFSISTFNGTSTLSESIDLAKIKLFDIEGISTKYYLQPESVIKANPSSYKNSNYEYLRFNYYNSSDTTNLYLSKDRYGNFFCGGERFLGNLCLSEPNITGNFLYWVESRPILSSPEYRHTDKLLVSQKFQYLENLDKTQGTEDGLQVWPTSDENFVWNEGSYATNDPALWENISADSSDGIVKMIALKRHYGVSNYDYHLICKLDNITDLYNALLNDYLELEETEEITGDENKKVSVINFNIGSNTVGTIKIEKIRE